MTPAELDALEQCSNNGWPYHLEGANLRWLISQARRAERAERVVDAARRGIGITRDWFNRQDDRKALVRAIAAYDTGGGK